MKLLAVQIITDHLSDMERVRVLSEQVNNGVQLLAAAIEENRLVAMECMDKRNGESTVVLGVRDERDGAIVVVCQLLPGNKSDSFVPPSAVRAHECTIDKGKVN